MKIELEKIKEIIAHIFFPNRCMSCGQVIEVFLNICEDCTVKLPFINSDNCLVCGQNKCGCDNMFFDRIYTPFYYEMGIKKAIIELKFKDNIHIANKLGYYMIEYIKPYQILEIIDFLVPVPMYKSDLKRRGYNQSLELARAIQKLTQIPLIDNLLYKVKKTKSQHKINSQDRYINLMNAFSIENSDIIKDKIILLIDDVFTTGSTVNNCSRILNDNGVKGVYVLTCCKTNYGRQFDKI